MDRIDYFAAKDSDGEVVACAVTVPAQGDGSRLQIITQGEVSFMRDLSAAVAEGAGLMFYPITPERFNDIKRKLLAEQ